MRIGKTSAYGLFAVLYVAKNGNHKSVQGREIAQAYGIPREYLLKILQALARGGILRSARGRCGGFTLTRPASRITLQDIVDVLESPTNLEQVLDEVVSGHAQVKKRICQTYQNMLSTARKSLNTVSLQQLLETSKRQR